MPEVCGHTLLTCLKVNSMKHQVTCVRFDNGTSLIRNCILLGPYRRPIYRALWWYRGGTFLMSEVILYADKLSVAHELSCAVLVFNNSPPLALFLQGYRAHKKKPSPLGPS